jgi:nucleotidyltransferase substrate binding protein (TIGR01987 family)
MSSVSKDIRWHQRLNNFEKALIQLRDAVNLCHQRPLSDLENQGMIQAFEFTHELAWNVIKDFFFDQGNSSIMGSKDATREAFQKGILEDGQNWMEMIRSRNLSTHTYHQNTAKEIAEKIQKTYFPLFEAFLKKMNELKSKK